MIISVIQGFGTAVALVVLFMLVPILFRKLARFEGIPQKTGVELSLMDRYFMFQVIVRVSCAVVDHITHKYTSDRLSGCLSF